MKKLIILLLLYLYPGTLTVIAQSLAGPRISAMGNNGAALRDLWSIEANTAGITSISSPTIGLNYLMLFFDSSLSQQAIALVLPIKGYHFGLAFQRYGFSAYNELKTGFALAKSYGQKLHLGLRANYHQLKISQYGQTATFSLDIGAQYAIKNNIVLGLYLSNPAQQQYHNANISIRIPSALQIGATYTASDQLLLAATINKTINASIIASLGIDYKIIKDFSLRGGLSLNPFKHYTGVGLSLGLLNIDVAVESDPYLGYSPQISLAYAF